MTAAWSARLPARHAWLALAVVAVWGTNFVVIKLALAALPPLFLALPVPVFGMAASAWWLGEGLPVWKLGAAALVMAGLAVNLFAPRRA